MSLITIDSRAIIQRFNAAAERIFGYKAKEVIGHNVNMLMPQPYQSKHDGYVSHYLETGKAKIIGIGRKRSRGDARTVPFPMELGVNEFSLTGAERVSSDLRDITQREQAEEALDRSTKQSGGGKSRQVRIPGHYEP